MSTVNASPPSKTKRLIEPVKALSRLKIPWSPSLKYSRSDLRRERGREIHERNALAALHEPKLEELTGASANLKKLQRYSSSRRDYEMHLIERRLCRRKDLSKADLRQRMQQDIERAIEVRQQVKIDPRATQEWTSMPLHLQHGPKHPIQGISLLDSLERKFRIRSRAAKRSSMHSSEVSLASGDQEFLEQPGIVITSVKKKRGTTQRSGPGPEVSVSSSSSSSPSSLHTFCNPDIHRARIARSKKALEAKKERANGAAFRSHHTWRF